MRVETKAFGGNGGEWIYIIIDVDSEGDHHPTFIGAEAYRRWLLDQLLALETHKYAGGNP